MTEKIEHKDYEWQNHESTCAHDYVLPVVIKKIKELYNGQPIKILDIGCGSGFVDSRLAELGYKVMGIDSSLGGVNIARSAYPNVRFEVCSIYEDQILDVVSNSIDCVISLDVIEHLFFPKKLFEQSFEILKPGGHFIVSTPFHGFIKNLSISLANRWDRHFGVDWDGGHIKFFSERTLSRMACNAGFKNPHFYNVGRLPWLWKSMIMVTEK